MAQSLANFDAALKNVYGPGLRNSINNSNPVLTEVVHDTENVSGRKCIWAVHSGRSTSTGARQEGAALPVADRQRYIGPEDTLAYLYHTIKVTGQAKNLTQGQAGAFARALDQEMTHAEKDIKNDLARQMFNIAITVNGVLVNGAIAGSHSSSFTGSSGVLTLEPAGTTAGATPDPTVYRYFFVGMLLDSVTASTGVITGTNGTVTAIGGAAAGTITVNGLTGIQTDDTLFRAGNYASGDNEINGLGYVVGTQTYAGVTAATNPVWNSLTEGSSTEGISENLLESAIEIVQTDGDGSTPSLAISAFSQGRKLASIIQQQKRFAPPATKLTAGWTGIEVAGLNLVFDRYSPTQTIYVLTPGELAWFVGLDWNWNDDAGYVLGKALDGSDAIEANYRAYVNLESYTRNAHTVVTVAAPVF